MIRCFFISFFILFIVFPVFAHALTFSASFDRNLKLGDSGEDVRQLQIFLNTNVLTQVNFYGPGSPRNETLYFGSATQNAVKKFQELYRNEILAPNGLIVGTGFVGVSTRAKIENLQNKAIPQVFSPQTILENNAFPQSARLENFSLFGLQSDDLHLAYPSTYHGRIGSELTLLGSGFIGVNTVHFGNQKQISVESQNPGLLQMKVPELPFGKYDVWVTNSKGASEKIFFIVIDPNIKKPEIIEISPEKAENGALITVKGKGFSQNDNGIRLGFATVEGVKSSDGETITFTLPNFNFSPRQISGSNQTVLAPFVPKIELPAMVYIENVGGLSNGKEFTLIYNYR